VVPGPHLHEASGGFESEEMMIAAGLVGKSVNLTTIIDGITFSKYLFRCKYSRYQVESPRN
jgi:hypothetical protein